MLTRASYAAVAAALAASVNALPAVNFHHPLGSIPENIFNTLELSTIVPTLNPISLNALTENTTTVHPFFPGTHQKRLNGADNRYQFTDQHDFPFATVGKFVRSDNIICSAQLIGPRHIILAHHCINGESSNPPVTMTFYPGYDNGPGPAGSAQVTSAYWINSPGGTGCDTKFDFAILILDKRLGDQLGYFGQVIPDSSRFNQAIFTSLGYPGDRDNTNRPYRQDSISLPSQFVFQQFACDQKTGPIYSDADVAGGQSGSALWTDGGYIWGITSITIGYGNNQGGGGYASGDAMQSLINNLRSQYP